MYLLHVPCLSLIIQVGLELGFFTHVSFCTLVHRVYGSFEGLFVTSPAVFSHLEFGSLVFVLGTG